MDGEYLLSLLPKRPQPVTVRIAVTAALVAFCFLFRIAAGDAAGTYALLLYLPGVIIPALLFDRGSGFFALGLTLVLVAATLDWTSAAHAQTHLAAGLIFVFISLPLVILTESLRKSLEQTQGLHQEKELLLRELGHRIKNDLATAVSIAAMQGRSQPGNREMQAQFDELASRLRVLASSYDHLRIEPRAAAIEMGPYLDELCIKLADRFRGLRPIAVRVQTDGVLARSEKASRLGLIINELVTNAFKHAFPENRAGVVDVSLRRLDHSLELIVEDNGVGCPQKPNEGMGSKLVLLLTEQLGGTFERKSSSGCRVRILIPPSRFH